MRQPKRTRVPCQRLEQRSLRSWTGTGLHSEPHRRKRRPPLWSLSQRKSLFWLQEERRKRSFRWENQNREEFGKTVTRRGQKITTDTVPKTGELQLHVLFTQQTVRLICFTYKKEIIKTRKINTLFAKEVLKLWQGIFCPRRYTKIQTLHSQKMYVITLKAQSHMQRLMQILKERICFCCYWFNK